MSIYKIYCKNPDIIDCYVGATKDFSQRINQHKLAIKKNSELKLYNFIRKHGGIDNWNFIILEDNIEYNILYDMKDNYLLLPLNTKSYI